MVATFLLSFFSRQGSIIVDFEVQTTQLNYSEIAVANNQLPAAMSSVAPLLGSVVASYKSKFTQYHTVILCENSLPV